MARWCHGRHATRTAPWSGVEGACPSDAQVFVHDRAVGELLRRDGRHDGALQPRALLPQRRLTGPGQPQTIAVRSFYSVLMRDLQGISRQFSTRNLGREVMKFSGLPTDRAANAIGQMTGIARGVLGKNLNHRVPVIGQDSTFFPRFHDAIDKQLDSARVALTQEGPMECTGWPRVPITIPPAPGGLSKEATEQALLSICRPLWAASKVPVVAWGSEFDGAELLPPIEQ